MSFSIQALTSRSYHRCCHTHDLADGDTLDELYLQLIRKVWDGEIQAGTIDEETAIATAKGFMEGVFKGFGETFTTVAFDTPDYLKLQSLEKSVYTFAGAKNYQELKALTLALKDGDRVLPFAEWNRKAMSIMQEYEGRFKRIEYNTAVGQSQMASHAVRFDKNPKALIKYLGGNSERSCPICQAYYGIILPWDHPFWRTAAPKNHFGCECGMMEVNDGSITPESEIPGFEQIPAIFRTNLAERGMVFPPGHPYYIGLPASVKKQAKSIIPKHSKK